jgi:uncharacterized protein YciI
MQAFPIRIPGRSAAVLAASLACLCPVAAAAAQPDVADPPPTPVASYDAELAARVGADERGMRRYVLVILRTGPVRVPDGDARKAMFAGHFANIQRLSDQGKLVLAGPFSADPDGWRGLFLLAVDDVAEARRLTETDPVVVNGEMVAEYHPWYGSAAAMMIPEIHARLAPEGP